MLKTIAALFLAWSTMGGLAYGQAALPNRGAAELSINFGAGTRSYVAHVPAGIAGKPAPMVIVLHGAGGGGATGLEQGRWVRAAERYGFIVLMGWTPPNGIAVPKWRLLAAPLEGGVRGEG